MRPFVLGLLTGVFALQNMAELPLVPVLEWLPVALLASAASFWLRMRGRRDVAAALAICAGAMLGFGYAGWRAETRLADALPQQWEGRDIDLTGVVSSLPQVNERGTRFEFDVEQIQTAGATVPPHLSLSWYAEPSRGSAAAQPAPQLRPGQRWQLTVRLRRPHGTQNPHGFDFEAWALERNIRATGYVRARGTNVLRDEFVASLGARVDRIRLAIRERMNAALQDQPYRGVLVALAIGEQDAIPAEQWRVFWRTGVGHLMSISGLHITMVASLLYWLTFRIWSRLPALALRLPAQRAAALAGALTALAYSLIAGFSVPTQRTFFMLSAVAVALWLGRAGSASRVLAWAMLAVLSIDPWAVLSPGFWLSFGAVAAILYVHAHRVGKLSGLREAAMTQLAVTAGLLPLTLFLFQEVSLVSPIANAFAIPVVSLVVVPLTLVGAALSFIGPFEFLMIWAHRVMFWCDWALQWLASAPNAVWQSHAPVLAAVGCALAGCAWCLLPRGAPARWLGLPMMLPLFLVVPLHPAQGEYWLTLLDVGQGLATVVQTSGHALVYDTGPSWNPDADSGNRIVVPYLRGEGVSKLDAMIVSHQDDDHSGGAHSIIAARDPAWVLTSMPPQHRALQGAREIMRCEVGDHWHWDGVDFEIVHPLAGNYEESRRKSNDMGCVLKISGRGGSVLLTADIEKKSEQELLLRETDLRADVLVMPHHGSKTSSTQAFLDAVQPKVALLPVGYRNRFHHPNAAVMERYAHTGLTVRRTDEEGALELRFGAAPALPEIRSWRASHRRYWWDVPMREEGLMPADP
ncbi:MAG: DNA internalization-related competence protein ComEC/Rec2 [Betaproteobacteria bacterium]|nr:DNA internalization-related competence protein ComEC/Rec2 [Betaproteobacteria bacterium]